MTTEINGASEKEVETRKKIREEMTQEEDSETTEERSTHPLRGVRLRRWGNFTFVPLHNVVQHI
jgi:hypothetical protein